MKFFVKAVVQPVDQHPGIWDFDVVLVKKLLDRTLLFRLLAEHIRNFCLVGLVVEKLLPNGFALRFVGAHVYRQVWQEVFLSLFHHNSEVPFQLNRVNAIAQGSVSDAKEIADQNLFMVAEIWVIFLKESE